jgi:C4-dicarboxylate-binding protein DctP
MRIRVAAPGLYEEILKSLGANPIPLPAKEIDDAFKRGELDGMSSSPGGWVLSGPIGNKGSLVPGLIFYTYSLIADKEWFESIPSKQQRVLQDAAKTCITDRWHDMKKDDTEVIRELVDRNNGVVSFTAVPASSLSQWKRRVEPVIKKFKESYPDAVENYHSLIK